MEDMLGARQKRAFLPELIQATMLTMCSGFFVGGLVLSFTLRNAIRNDLDRW